MNLPSQDPSTRSELRRFTRHYWPGLWQAWFLFLS